LGSSRLAGAAELFGGQQGIHRSGAEAFQIEGDELESQRFEDGGELGCHGGIQSAFHFLTVDLDAHRFAVMADAELPEAEGSNGVFAALDY